MYVGGGGGGAVGGEGKNKKWKISYRMDVEYEIMRSTSIINTEYKYFNLTG